MLQGEITFFFVPAETRHLGNATHVPDLTAASQYFSISSVERAKEDTWYSRQASACASLSFFHYHTCIPYTAILSLGVTCICCFRYYVLKSVMRRQVARLKVNTATRALSEIAVDKRICVSHQNQMCASNARISTG